LLLRNNFWGFFDPHKLYLDSVKKAHIPTISGKKNPPKHNTIEFYSFLQPITAKKHCRISGRWVTAV